MRSITLSIQDLQIAHDAIIRQEQCRHPPSLRCAKDLNIKFDVKTKLLRCFGRYERSAIEQEAINPIYLPPDSWITSLIVSETHLKVLHAGPTITLATIRQKYWIPQGKTIIRKVTIYNKQTRCYKCCRPHVKPYTAPPEPPLPSFRSNALQVFENTGLDYFGPLKTRNSSNEIMKSYGVIFDCLTYRAIKL